MENSYRYMRAGGTWVRIEDIRALGLEESVVSASATVYAGVCAGDRPFSGGECVLPFAEFYHMCNREGWEVRVSGVLEVPFCEIVEQGRGLDTETYVRKRIKEDYMKIVETVAACKADILEKGG